MGEAGAWRCTIAVGHWASLNPISNISSCLFCLSCGQMLTAPAGIPKQTLYYSLRLTALAALASVLWTNHNSYNDTIQPLCRAQPTKLEVLVVRYWPTPIKKSHPQMCQMLRVKAMQKKDNESKEIRWTYKLSQVLLHSVSTYSEHWNKGWSNVPRPIPCYLFCVQQKTLRTVYSII